MLADECASCQRLANFIPAWHFLLVLELVKGWQSGPVPSWCWSMTTYRIQQHDTEQYDHLLQNATADALIAVFLNHTTHFKWQEKLPRLVSYHVLSILLCSPQAFSLSSLLISTMLICWTAKRGVRGTCVDFQHETSCSFTTWSARSILSWNSGSVITSTLSHAVSYGLAHCGGRHTIVERSSSLEVARPGLCLP